MKALVKPNMHTCLAGGGLSKHLQNLITHILGVESDKVELSADNSSFTVCFSKILSSSCRKI